MKFGLYFYSTIQAQDFYGEGLLCVGLPLQRIQPLLLTDNGGNASLQLDLTQPPFSAGPFAIEPYSTWNFQFRYRDPLGDQFGGLPTGQ